MAAQTKMIIITSDEDIIRQFSFNKTNNTHIIDLDNGNQVNSTENNNNNITNLNLLAQLSGINSNNDQIYKRALDSSDHKRSKPVKVPKKSVDLICTICGDHAVGFNYDVLSCSSCKAFFRRNANQNLEKLRCLTGQGQCSVAHDMRRKCPRCRLSRCFAMGMRKDFILSEEEKQRRRKRLEENRDFTSKRSSTSESTNSSSISQPVFDSESISEASDEIDRLLMDMNKDDDDIVLNENTNLNQMEYTLFETLSVEDWLVIESVRSSFLSVFQSPAEACAAILDLSDRTSALVSWSQFFSQIALRFINFFRQIDEFESLDADDRFTLIKYNLFLLFPISKCFSFRPTNDCCLSGGCKEAEVHKQFFMLCGFPDSYRQSFVNSVISLVEITEQDPTLLSLLVIILLFSPGLSMSEDEPLLKDSLAVLRVQSHYTRVLWNYLINRWDELQACRFFTQLLNVIFRIQSGAKNKLDLYRAQFTSLDDVDRIAPLMQAVLHIS